MLVALLQVINNHPLASLEQVSQELQASPELIAVMVADLAKRGYLKSYENCTSACVDCALSSACEGTAHPKIWTLTDKGRELASR